ncbi:conserved hypothetical protein [Cupriavidus neocaledonicus]|uniref:Tyrosine specific protein phosphatases domain-containing protein n=1 Tax=Cupriavidus neocaledonicus TaxID=1040979 RepID=A0ABY1V139_9BURK|nr:hypothetical protein [Cupriavidus neocaledonicus]SOZ36203.1 conserved hypothetical protein [Cupriavidus neocaledonicus]
MTLRLKGVIAALYRRPDDGIRQVFALSRDEAERLPRLPWVAIISIIAPGRHPANVDGFEHVVRASFADVDFLSPNLSQRARASLGEAFTVEQAQVIRRFVESLPSDVTSVVIHCEGGYSRSCAVALALHRLYGYHVVLRRLAQTNPSVVILMMGEGRPQRKTRRGQV